MLPVSQSGPGRNGKEWVLLIFQSSRDEAHHQMVKYHFQGIRLIGLGVCWDTLSEFYLLSQLISVIIFIKPLRSDRIWHKVNLTGLNSEFSFSQTSCLSKAEEFNLPYYLPIAEGRIIDNY